MTINSALDCIDLSQYRNVDFGHDHSYFFDPSGREHYRMLAYYSRLTKGLIFDIGTYRCLSAWALSDHPESYVVSYDIQQALEVNPQRANIEYKIGSALKDSRLLKAKLIFVDVAHDGLYESEVIEYLKKKKWHGVTIWDDIHLNPEMEAFWAKYGGGDFTFIGHYTGTGIIKL